MKIYEHPLSTAAGELRQTHTQLTRPTREEEEGESPHTDGGGGGDAKINKEETKRPGNQTNTSEPGLVAVMPRR